MPVIRIYSPEGANLAAAVMRAMACGPPDPAAVRVDGARRSKPEKTQRRNPHGLVCNQHVFPVRSIERFTGFDGRVTVRDLARERERPAKPKDAIFCARRAWDHRAETGFMKTIEDDFQKLARRIINAKTFVSTPEHKRVVDRMYGLWYTRARRRDLRMQEATLNGVVGAPLSKQDEEVLERKGYLFARSGGQMPFRQLNGLWLQREVDAFAERPAAKECWGVIRPQSGEFIVADVPAHPILPLTPTLALVGDAPNGVITTENLAALNREIIAYSSAYYFARDLAACPV